MSDDWHKIPPGQVWVPVNDLPASLQALALLIDHILHFDAEVLPQDYDEI